MIKSLRRLCTGPALSVVVVLTLISLVFSGLQASAASPDWTTYGWTNSRTGFNASETVITPSSASQLQLAWSASSQNVSPNLVFSQPVVSNGLVYWASMDGYERATNAWGGLVWQTYIGRTSACGFSNGPASTATVANGVVYVGGGDAQFYALNAQTGSILWQSRLGPSPSTFVWSSPAVYDGSVYIGVASFADCPLVQGQLVKVDAATGVVENAFNTVPNGCIGAGVWGSPTVDEANSTIYFATGNGGSCNTSEPYAEAVIEVRASDLGLLGSWQIPVSQQIFDGDFGSTPTLFTRTVHQVQQTMVALANKNGLYYAFEANNLAAGPQWTTRVAVRGDCPNCGQGAIAPSAWDGTNLYIGGTQVRIKGVSCAGSLTALNPASGATVWQKCLQGGPVLGAIASAPGIVAVGEGNQILLVSATTGQTLFSYTTQSTVWGAPSIANGVLYVGDNSGSLYALSLYPVTHVLIPSNDASMAGTQYLDAAAGNATSVKFLLFGGSYGYAAPVICTATPTYFGWLCSWNTTTVPDGSYVLVSEASNTAGRAFSSGVNVTVAN